MTSVNQSRERPNRDISVLEEPSVAGDKPANEKVVTHFTPAERTARGKVTRAEVPRSLQVAVASGRVAAEAGL